MESKMDENMIEENTGIDSKNNVQDLRGFDTLEGFPEVMGYDFDEKFDFDNFMGSFKNMGIQANAIADIYPGSTALPETLFISHGIMALS